MPFKTSIILLSICVVLPADMKRLGIRGQLMGPNVHYEYPYGKNVIVYLHPSLSNHRIWVCLNSNALLAFFKNGVVR